jgi:uncharacterized protein (DUF1697 family)
MPTYIALLRGINIGPHKRMKMEKLRASCESLKFTDVQSYIQSGNLLFRAPKLTDSALSKQIEKCIERDFGFSAEVIIRTREEMKSIVNSNPLSKDKGVDVARLHVVFLREKPSSESLKRLEELTLPPDRVRSSGREIYFYFPNGVSGSSLWKHPLDKVLSTTATMRNWTTLNKLYAMALELG